VTKRLYWLWNSFIFSIWT